MFHENSKWRRWRTGCTDHSVETSHPPCGTFIRCKGVAPWLLCTEWINDLKCLDENRYYWNSGYLIEFELILVIPFYISCGCVLYSSVSSHCFCPAQSDRVRRCIGCGTHIWSFSNQSRSQADLSPLSHRLLPVAEFAVATASAKVAQEGVRFASSSLVLDTFSTAATRR